MVLTPSADGAAVNVGRLEAHAIGGGFGEGLRALTKQSLCELCTFLRLIPIRGHPCHPWLNLQSAEERRRLWKNYMGVPGIFSSRTMWTAPPTRPERAGRGRAFALEKPPTQTNLPP